ncbi:MAG: DUF294 nucleotidyltransferase-like domain-containing protein [Deferribacteraceae bacterium]|nr:DUF294 nucleotidyltransferase-like domain-containing protein [Deferribacteraceae bacterium]
MEKIPVFQGIAPEILFDSIVKPEQLHLLKGEAVYTQGETYHRGVYFIESGDVTLIESRENEESASTREISLKANDAVGISTFIGKTVYLLRAEAASDLNLIFINDTNIYSLMTASPVFRRRFKELLAERLKSVKTITNRYQNIPIYSNVGSVMTSPIISIHPSATLKDAADAMAKHQVNALLLTTKRQTVKGIITAASVVKNYGAAEGARVLDYAAPPFTFPLSYPLNVAYEAMKKLNEDYAVIIHRKKPLGLVSKAELSALLAETSVTFAASVAQVTSIDELKQRVLTFPLLFSNYMNNAYSLSELIPKLANWHRIVKKRAFEIAYADFENTHKRPLTNFCITSAGGNALAELGLSFMQLNSMIIMSDDKSEVSLCRKFAHHFSETLAKIGYEHNTSGVSLNNPDMAKSFGEWEGYFSKTLTKNIANVACIRTLLDSVYFCGDDEIYWDYRSMLSALLQERRFIPKELLQYQKRMKLPISDYEYFITDGIKEGIDLKSHALDFLTNLTQVYAIAGEISHTDTPRRLRHMVRIGLISEELAQEVIFAYETIINIIIHEHLDQQLNNRPVNFRIEPAKLSVRASKQLKLALHISKKYLSVAVAKFEGISV